MLGVNFDPRELYETDDRSYLVWLSTVIERVHRTHEKQRGD